MLQPLRLCLALLALFAQLSEAANSNAEVARARQILTEWQGNVTTPARSPHIVLWTPADREFSDQYQGRLEGVLGYVRDFFRSGMEEHGFGSQTLRFLPGDGGKFLIHTVRGKRPMDHYTPGHAGEIREDCFRVLRAAKIDPNRETVLIFCNSSNWNPDNATYSEMPLFPSKGNHLSGLAWLVDSPILNIAYLDEDGPDFSHASMGRLSLREYNRHALHRILHETGRALGLIDHRAPLADQQGSPAFLMGTPPKPGDPAWFDDPRMTITDALQLAAHPLFSGSGKYAGRPYSARVTDWKAEVSSEGFLIAGTVAGNPPVHSVIAYLHTRDLPDSEATAVFCAPDANGHFEIRCTDLVASSAAELRVVVLQANGATSGYGMHRFPYQIGPDRDVDLTHAQAIIALMPLAEALWKNDQEMVQRYLNENPIADNPVLLEIAQRWIRGNQMGPKATIDPQLASVALSDLSPASSVTGYGPAVQDRLPGPSPLLISGGRLFTHGLYAHAPSKYAWKLDGTWRQLSGSVGIAQDHPGSAVFEILGDGVLLWRSPIVRSGQLRTFQIPTHGVQHLVLQTTDAGDGKDNDWSLWLEPKLNR